MNSEKALSLFGRDGRCRVRIPKVVKNRVYLKSIGRTFNGCSLWIVGFCQKK